MKKLDIKKYKKRMSCSVEITENKIDFEEDEELLNVVRKPEKRGRLRRRWRVWTAKESRRKERQREKEREKRFDCEREEKKRETERERERETFWMLIINAFRIFFKTLKIVVDWHVSFFSFCRMKILKWSGSDILIYRETCHLLV